MGDIAWIFAWLKDKNKTTMTDIKSESALKPGVMENSFVVSVVASADPVTWTRVAPGNSDHMYTSASHLVKEQVSVR